MFLIDSLEQREEGIEQYSHDTENHYRHNHGSELENLAGIDNQIAQASFAANQLSNDNANEGQADI